MPTNAEAVWDARWADLWREIAAASDCPAVRVQAEDVIAWADRRADLRVIRPVVPRGVRRDMRQYRWSLGKSLMVNLWWGIEHLGVYRGGDGGLFGYVRRYGRRRRRAWERR